MKEYAQRLWLAGAELTDLIDALPDTAAAQRAQLRSVAMRISQIERELTRDQMVDMLRQSNHEPADTHTHWEMT